MNPAFSLLFFTTLAGLGQGMAVLLAVAHLANVPLPRGFLLAALGLAILLLLAGLASSFLHLGKKMRAWRAVLMWRTSWMSREVIVLPLCLALMAAWWLAVYGQAGSAVARVLPLLVVLSAVLLWVCTGMIYACLRFVQEWAHALTVVNLTLIGLASGMLLACALAAAGGEPRLLAAWGPATVLLTLLAWAGRAASLRRNARLRPKSTLQSATGIHAARLVQKSMGMSAGSFNTREFFHGASALALKKLRLGFQLLAFAIPAVLMLLALAFGANWLWILAAVVQLPGLLAERWFFFAQANHPQNLYYQAVS